MFNTNDFVVGDTVWFNAGYTERLSGIIHKVLTSKELDFNEDHYIILVSTHIDDYLEIRPKSLVYRTK